MSADSSLKKAFISFVVVGLLGLLFRYVFGGDGNRSKIHEMFLDVLDFFYWVFLYILLPLIALGLIGILIKGAKGTKESDGEDKVS